MRLILARHPSPLGELVIAAAGDTIYQLDFEDCLERMHGLLRKRLGTIELEEGRLPFAEDALMAYFSGDLTALDRLRADPGGTAFQAAVWRGLRSIPPGDTWTYAGLARHVGRPKAVRAVGRTNGLNPVALVLPCHRVIGSDGSFTGYAGGIERKAWLLRHEGALLR